MADSEGPPRAVLIAAVVLAVGAISVILAIAATRHPPAGSRMSGSTGSAAAAARRLSARPHRAADAPGHRRLAGRKRWRAGGVAVWPQPPGRLRRRFANPARRPGAVV